MSGSFDEISIQKNNIYVSATEIFCNIINVFIITFDHFKIIFAK